MPYSQIELGLASPTPLLYNLIPLGKNNFIILFRYSATECAARFAFVRRSPESLRSRCSSRVCVREM